MVGSIGPRTNKNITKKDLKEEIYRMANIISHKYYERQERYEFLVNRILYLESELKWEDEYNE